MGAVFGAATAERFSASNLVRHIENGSAEPFPTTGGLEVRGRQIAMPSTLKFRKLNEGWNAEPNAPSPVVDVDGRDLLLRFYLNPFAYPGFVEADSGILRFKDFSSYRLGSTNDEGWYRGQCRYSKLAPEWGELYQICGDDPLRRLPSDWQRFREEVQSSGHFLFYFRDETFECIADNWEFESVPENALFRKRPPH